MTVALSVFYSCAFVLKILWKSVVKIEEENGEKI